MLYFRMPGEKKHLRMDHTLEPTFTQHMSLQKSTYKCIELYRYTNIYHNMCNKNKIIIP